MAKVFKITKEQVKDFFNHEVVQKKFVWNDGRTFIPQCKDFILLEIMAGERMRYVADQIPLGLVYEDFNFSLFSIYYTECSYCREKNLDGKKLCNKCRESTFECPHCSERKPNTLKTTKECCVECFKLLFELCQSCGNVKSKDRTCLCSLITVPKLDLAFQKHCAQMGYPISAVALESLFTHYYVNKSPLMELFSKHPDWDKENLCISTKVEVKESLDTCKYYLDSLYNSQSTRDYSEVYSYIRNNMSATVDETLANIANTTYSLNIKSGMKLTRLVNRLWGAASPYDFDKLAAYLSRLSTTYPAVFSLNAMDYLTMSNGNSWSSCHIIGHQYGKGPLALMMDETSVVCYLRPSKTDGTAPWQLPKVKRQLFHINVSTRQFLQNRMYPERVDSLADVLRLQLESILETAGGWRGKWVTSSNTDEISGMIAYPDWDCSSHNPLHVYLKEFGNSERELIKVGSYVPCLSCGQIRKRKDQTYYCTSCSQPRLEHRGIDAPEVEHGEEY